MAFAAQGPLVEPGQGNPDPRWELVLRVADSSAFVKAPVLRRFLLYVCEQALRGQGAELKEQQIGCEVFGRPPGYNAAEDNIVRVRAREVRQRLERYFQTEGIAEPVLITIPKGHYVPVFELRQADGTAGVAYRQPEGPREAGRRRSPRRWLWCAPAVPAAVALGLAVAAYRSSIRPPAAWQRSVPAYRLLWGQLYDRKQPTLIIAADSSFALLQDMSRRNFSLQEYIERSYVPKESGDPAETGRLIARRQYTSLADINVLARILQIHPAFAQFTQVRFARHAELRDFKNRNVIVLGSPRGNPWAELFEGQLNFLARHDPLSGRVYFQNVAPRPGEPERFVRGETAGEEFATVALLRNLANSGWVLILSGLTSFGTEAAGEAVARPDLCRTLLRSAGIPSEGPVTPFEALLKLKAVAGGPADISVVACRRPRS